LGRAARVALDDLRMPLRELLKKRVSDLFVESNQEPA
jgi:membrane protein